MNTQGFSYWLDGMPVCGVCCLIVLIVFVSPPKANTENVPCMIVWKSDQWREVCLAPEHTFCLKWFTMLIMTLEPWTVSITVSSHSTCDIASSHKDKSLQRQCQGGAAVGCEGLHCFTLHSVLSLFPISVDLIMFFYQLPSSSQSFPPQWQSSSAALQYWGCFSWRPRVAGQEEGAEVNYSITVWLSQELFKQTPVSRGLVLITPARVNAHDPSPLPLTMGLSGILGKIHIVGGGQTYRKKKEIKTKQSGKDGWGKEEQTAKYDVA